MDGSERWVEDDHKDQKRQKLDVRQDDQRQQDDHNDQNYQNIDALPVDHKDWDDNQFFRCTLCSGRGFHYGTHQPDFATFNKDPEAWRQLLSSMGIDDTAMADLFALANHSAGYDLALSLIHKVLKNKSGPRDSHYRNISGFIVSSVKRAWETMPKYDPSMPKETMPKYEKCG